MRNKGRKMEVEEEVMGGGPKIEVCEDRKTVES